jgi:subtilase family serine protease
VTATVGQLERAFSINLVRYNLGDRIAFSNTAAPLFGASVAGTVQGVIGLSNIYLAQHQSILSAPSTKRLAKPRTSPRVYNAGPTPCSAAVTDGEEYDAYTANKLATAYSFSSLYSASDLGAGQTVAIFELEPNEASDISAYKSCYGISTSVTYIEEDGGAGTGYGSGEAALDIEDVAGLAPDAKIDVYQAPNSGTGLIDNYTAIVDADTAKVVSTSWGLCEPLEGSSVISEENTIFEQAATQGQSVFAAAGDHGSEDCYASNGSTSLAVDDPASQPFVTGVGGTSLSAIGPPPTQTVWNESSTSEGAGGGGISSSWKMPSYQSGAPSTLNVINSHSSGTPCAAVSGSYCREVPDVTADADPYDGYVVFYDGEWTAIGGTSAAAPLWAAFMALTNAGCTAPIGFANPTLYNVAGSSSYSSTFSDITSGNNDYTGTNSGLYPAGTAYDMGSGLGSPKGSALPAALCSVGVQPPIAGGLTPLTPARILDTRVNNGASGPVPAENDVSLQVEGRGGVPASGVSAVVLNVTLTDPQTEGYLTVYPDGVTRPVTSNLNFSKGQTIPNLVVAPVGSDGKVDFYNGSAGTVQIVGDVSGWFASGSAGAGGLTPLTPDRIMDTRVDNGVSGPVPAEKEVSLQVEGRGGVPAYGVGAVVLNVTVTSPQIAGYLTVYPDGVTRPTTSNLNFSKGETIPNLVVAPVGSDGKVDFYNGSGETVQIIADVSGWWSSA